MLQQGSHLPPGRAVSTTPLPDAKQLLTEPPTPQHELMPVQLPKDTAGLARSGRHKPTALRAPTVPTSAAPLVITVSAEDLARGIVLPALPSVNVIPESTTSEPVSRTTLWRRRREAARLTEAEEAGLQTKRKYVRTASHNKCGKCGKAKNASTGHSQLKGHWFCPENSEGLSKEEWLQAMKSQDKA